MISDELLCSATGEYEKAILSALPETTECNHTFSQRFEKKMRHLCHKTKHQPTYHILKRIACVLVAIILCGSMLLMLHIDVRAAVVGWIKEVYNSFIR